MQPLALQTLSSSIDAGDTSGNLTPNLGANSSVAFNDLMSEADAAADRLRTSEAAQAQARAAEQEKSAAAEKDAEHSVAALTAAAQFASRNVKLKQRAAAEEQSRAEMASRSARDRAHSQKTSAVSKDEPTPPENEKTESKAGEQTNASMAPEALNTSTKDIPEGHEKTSASSNVDLSTAPLDQAAKKTTGDIQASNPEALIVTDEDPAVKTIAAIQNLTSPEAKNDTNARIELEKTNKKSADQEDGIVNTPAQIASKDPNAAARKATAPEATNLLSMSAPDTSSTQLTPDPVTGTTANKFETAAKDDDNSHNAAPAVAGNPQIQTQDTAAVANLMAQQAPVTPNTSVVAADPLLAQRRSQTSDQNPTLTQPSSNLLAAAAPQMPEPDAATKRAWVNTPETTDLSDKTKSPKAATTAGQSELPLTAAPEETQSLEVGGSTPQQKLTNQQLANALQAKTNSGPNQPQSAEAGKVSVSLEELAKLGVKNVTLNAEPKAALTSSTQDPAPAPAPTPTSTTATPSQAQTASSTTANSETNGERRSIAADIRLRAMERMVVAAARAGTQNLTLQLYPPGLGQVMIRLVMDGQRLRIVTRAANAEAVNTLKGMEGDLRQALSGNGLNLTEFDVNDDQHDEEQARRQSSPEPAIKPSTGGKNDSFTIDMNA